MRIIYPSHLTGKKKSGAFGVYRRLKGTNRGVKFLGEDKREALKEFKRLKAAYARCKNLVPKPFYLAKRRVWYDWGNMGIAAPPYTMWEYGYVMEHFKGRHPSIQNELESPLLNGLRDELRKRGVIHEDLHSHNVLRTHKGYRVIDFGVYGVRIVKRRKQ